MSEVQAVIFRKQYWSTRKARSFLRKKGYKPIKRVDETKYFYRYRITNPGRYKRFITRKSKDYKTVRYILGHK